MSKVKMVTVSAVATGLTALLIAASPAAHAHGTQVCGPDFPGDHNPWPASRQITSNEAKYVAVKAYQYCHLFRIEPSPNANSWSGFSRINNSAATGYLRTVDGVRHKVLVDHDQIFTNGQWFTGWNTNGKQG